MRSFRKVVVLATCLSALAACSQREGTDPAAASAPETAPAPPPKPAVPALPETGDGSTPLADFTVTPGHVFACEGRDHVTSTVKWVLKDSSVVTVKVLVGDRGSEERKTFASGPNLGEAVTGNWVGDGTHFFLVDGATGKELASYEVPSVPCT